MKPTCALSLTTSSPEQTARLAERLGADLRAGDVVLLDGPVGAGKSLFARALIQSRLAALGRHEEVPSPSFTLVQTYDAGDVEIWHADLYRLTDALDMMELGIEQAFEDAICLVEWPQRLGPLQPESALTVQLVPGAEPCARALHFAAADPRWHAPLGRLADSLEAGV